MIAVFCLTQASLCSFTDPLSPTTKKYLDVKAPARLTSRPASRPQSSQSIRSTHSTVSRPRSVLGQATRSRPLSTHERAASSSSGNNPTGSMVVPGLSRSQTTSTRPMNATTQTSIMPPPPTIPLRRSKSVHTGLSRPNEPAPRAPSRPRDVIAPAMDSVPSRSLSRSATGMGPQRIRQSSNNSSKAAESGRANIGLTIETLTTRSASGPRRSPADPVLTHASITSQVDGRERQGGGAKRVPRPITPVIDVVKQADRVGKSNPLSAKSTGLIPSAAKYVVALFMLIMEFSLLRFIDLSLAPTVPASCR